MKRALLADLNEIPFLNIKMKMESNNRSFLYRFLRKAKSS